MKIAVVFMVIAIIAACVWLISSSSTAPPADQSGFAGTQEPTPSETPAEEEHDSKTVALEKARKQAQEMLAEKYSLPKLMETVKGEPDDSKALIALKHIRDKHPSEAEKAYATLIDDDQLGIRKRVFAINAFGELKTATAVEKLKKIAQDKSDTLLALTAIGALSKCGDEDVIQFLEDLAKKSEVPEIRQKCSWSVRQIRASLKSH